MFRVTILTAAVLAAVVPFTADAAPAAAPGVPQFAQAVRHDTSIPLREILAQLPDEPALDPAASREIPNMLLSHPLGSVDPSRMPNSPIAQRAPNGVAMPPVDVAWNGVNNIFGVMPPDTNGDVGGDFFIQYINLGWAIFNKNTGVKVDIPGDPDDILPGNSFWAGFGGICQTNNSGDPIVLYDEVADRWVFSQFTGSGTPRQCFAVSTTNDPLGPYHRYEFNFSPQFNDYPHIGIWVDESSDQSGYYFVTHDFQGGFVGASYVAVDRDSMLTGAAAQMVRFQGFDAYGAQPPHLEGTVLAEAGQCAPFVHFDDDTSDYLFWEFCVDWATPANSTISADPIRVPASASFSNAIGDIEQLGTTSGLNSFPLNVMYRASARAFPYGDRTNLAMVINHAVNVGGGQAGVRWVEFSIGDRDALDPDSLFADGFQDSLLSRDYLLIQDGEYAPDANSRWMGGINMDANGNIGLGYSVSSAAIKPVLAISGRGLGDTPGTLRNEVACTPANTGHQTSTSARWGDYASMSVDSDQCTFWFTSEYHDTDSSGAWDTRVCSFSFPDCGQPDFRIEAQGASRAEICSGDGDPRMLVRTFTVGGFSSPVTLSLTGLPGGVTAGFEGNPINTYPGAAAITLVGAQALASGEYQSTVSATDGSLVRTLPISFGVSSGTAAATTPTSPADDAVGASARPTLTWAAVPGALSYTVELATDAGFTNIIETAEVTATEYTTQALAFETEHFWRVTTQNYCGEGATSVIFSFTTGTPGTCPGGTSANVLFSDNAETAGTWTTGGTLSSWARVAAPGDWGSATTVWLGPDTPATTDQYLISQQIAIPAGQEPVTLAYRTIHDLETDGPAGCWDGGFIEVSTDNGVNWTQVSESALFTDAYTGPITANPANPAGGSLAWCAEAAPVISVVDLNDYAGQSIRLRFRVATDGNTGTDAGFRGWFLDDFNVQSCQ